MSDTTLHSTVTRHRGSVAAAWALLSETIPGLIGLWKARRRDRSELAALDDHMLFDIGLTTDEAQAEAGKPFWRE